MSLFRQHCVQTQHLHISIYNETEKIKMASQTKIKNAYKTDLHTKFCKVSMCACMHACMHTHKQTNKQTNKA
jgi:hypothetical protein